MFWPIPKHNQPWPFWLSIIGWGYHGDQSLTQSSPWRVPAVVPPGIKCPLLRRLLAVWNRGRKVEALLDWMSLRWCTSQWSSRTPMCDGSPGQSLMLPSMRPSHPTRVLRMWVGTSTPPVFYQFIISFPMTMIIIWSLYDHYIREEHLKLQPKLRTETTPRKAGKLWKLGHGVFVLLEKLFNRAPKNVYLYLVRGIPTPLKNMKVSWDDDIPNWMEKCSKPPTSVSCEQHFQPKSWY